MAARSLFPMLSVSDLEASLSFYRDLLGGVEAFRFPEDDPVFLTLKLGESELGIGKVSEAPLHGQAQRPAQGHRIELCVYVDDVEATVGAAREAGVEVVAEPADQPWGERTAYLADPDGNLVLLTCEAPKGDVSSQLTS